jgi:predicted transcriptional regulator
MSHPVIFLTSADNVLAVVRKMSRFSISQMPVMDDKSQIGSVVDSNIVHLMLDKPSGAGETVVTEIMGKPFPEVSLSTSLCDINVFLEKRVAVLVVDDGVVKGIISRVDAMRVLA